jgi:eukaryotic-like serine/threonine-protein kinase
MIGTRLAHYEITNHLGSGGMGDVYQATDTKLGRSIAIKFLPEAFSHDTERVARFQREARVLASLNHSNIAGIYGVEQIDSRHFLVMELVDGETLAERIKRGPIPVDEVLSIAKSICEALEAAHEKGIVHRDLKPANVKIKLDGKVKVLDFGLAKAFEAETSQANLSQSPTLSLAATNAGIILGTAAYMSPEQAKGIVADERSDVFSFGCVLFELLTGRQLFQGETVAEMMGAVLVAQPDLSALLPENLNPRIRDLLRRCIEKNPKRRWYAIADLRMELEGIATQPSTAPLRAQPIETQLWKRVLPYAIAVALTGIIAGLVGWRLHPPSSVPAVARFAVSLPQGQLFTSVPGLAISRDGRRIAYIANQQLYVRSIDDMTPRAIPAGIGATSPVFSPDGQWIAFQGGNNIQKIRVSGGLRTNICEADIVYGMTWEGNQIFFGQGDRILRVTADGGRPEMVVRGNPGEFMDSPQVLEGGKALLFSLATESGPTRWDTAQVVVQSLENGARTVVLRGGGAARYVPTGHLLYVQGNKVMAVPFDISRLQTVGEAVQVLDSVKRLPLVQNRGFSDYAYIHFSATGSAVYIAGTEQGLFSPTVVAMVDRNGKASPLMLPPRPYVHPRISPDGKQLVLGTDDGTIYLYDLDRGEALCGG